MTDYTILSNTAVGVGGLPSGATVTALRDNPLAIAEGTAGAPQLRKVPLVIAQTVITGTPSSVDFFFDPDLYDDVSFSLSNVIPTNDNVFFSMQLSNDGTTFGGTSDILASSVGNAAGEEGVSGYATMHGPSLLKKTVVTSGVFRFTATGGFGGVFSAFDNVTSAQTFGAQFYFSAGTMASGTITMYGVLKA